MSSLYLAPGNSSSDWVARVENGRASSRAFTDGSGTSCRDARRSRRPNAQHIRVRSACDNLSTTS